MNTLRDIAEKLYNANNILLYPHVGTDGDAVGSCVAIAKAQNHGEDCVRPVRRGDPR